MERKILIGGVIIIAVVATGARLFYFSGEGGGNATATNNGISTSTITYINTDYGFRFVLPLDWQGYSIIKTNWDGNTLTGPKLLIRNPKWTAAVPYQDLPLLVFTISQWNDYRAEKFSISAAPIQATELGRNDTYVFALPPRWDFDYSLGYANAQRIFAGKPLSAFNLKSEAINPKNATYTIDGKTVTLVNGVSIVPIAPNSASMITTRYFGNEVSYDFDHDGRSDTAFILSQNTGGSGTFYYVVVALNTARGYVGSSGFLLGDRIAPQTTDISRNTASPDVLVVNYADRKAGESFATPPSVGKSVWLKLDTATMQFGVVEQHFPGEANPAQMTLGMKTWNWVSTTYNNNTAVIPKTNKFALTFKTDGSFSATTDCNGVGGQYAVSGNTISLTKMISTLMYCEGSQEQAYSNMLSQVQSYSFTSKGELVFNLKLNAGNMVFR